MIERSLHVSSGDDLRDRELGGNIIAPYKAKLDLSNSSPRDDSTRTGTDASRDSSPDQGGAIDQSVAERFAKLSVQDWLEWASPIAADLEFWIPAASPTPQTSPAPSFQRVAKVRPCRFFASAAACCKDSSCMYAHDVLLVRKQIPRPCKDKRRRLRRQAGRTAEQILVRNPGATRDAHGHF